MAQALPLIDKIKAPTYHQGKHNYVEAGWCVVFLTGYDRFRLSYQSPEDGFMLARLRRAVRRVIQAALQTALHSQQLRRLGASFVSRCPAIAARLLRIAGVIVPYTPEYGPYVARGELTEPAQAIYDDLRRLYHQRRARDRQTVKAMENDSR